MPGIAYIWMKGPLAIISCGTQNQSVSSNSNRAIIWQGSKHGQWEDLCRQTGIAEDYHYLTEEIILEQRLIRNLL